MPPLVRQTWTLIKKNLIIAAVRRPISSVLRAVIFPLAIVLIVSFAQDFLNPPQQFGTGRASAVLSLPQALSRASSARDSIAFIHDDKASEGILNVVRMVSQPFRDAGKTIRTATSQDTIQSLCETSQRGASNCYGAVIIHSSPDWPEAGGVWNYTLRADSSLGNSIDVTSPNNDAQIYLVPLQQAIDHAITEVTPDYQGPDLMNIMQYPFTKETEEKRLRDTRDSYLNAGIAYFGVVFFLGMVGVVYQLTGMMAYEREAGLSQLVEAMMPNIARWQPQVVRLLAHHLAFSAVYFPSWLAIGIILAAEVFTFTNPAITIIYHLLSGLALCSYSTCGGALFKRAQLSGIAMTVIAVALAIIPQVLTDEKQTKATVIALSLIFPSANYTYFITFVSRWEVQHMSTKLSSSAPDSPWQIRGVYFWIFLVIQIIIYPICAMMIERFLFSTVSSSRRLSSGEISPGLTVRIQGFSKTYRQNPLSKLFTKKRADVQAVKDLDLVARKGQILMLLGPNGSGKSTTLDAIAGLNRITGGQIELDGSSGLGIAPQKNVLWDDLTVREHVRIFYNLKSAGTRATSAELNDLLDACDIIKKAKAKSKTLSGGQKRKVQLAMMFAGGSAVCCVDEVSSGLDPLSRRKVWDILLAQRSSRTIIMTTHFLDEADFLSDHIAILSKGVLKAEGSSAELKQRYGKGYTVDANRPASGTASNDSYSKSHNGVSDRRAFTTVDAVHATELIEALERNGIEDYRVSGPTLEDVFLRLVGTSITSTAPAQNPSDSPALPDGVAEKQRDVTGVMVAVTERKGVDLYDGQNLIAAKQAWVLFMKRLMVFRRKWGPHVSAAIVALIGAGVSPLFLKYYEKVECLITEDQVAYAAPLTGYSESLTSSYGIRMAGGPVSMAFDQSLANVARMYSADSYSVRQSQIDDAATLRRNIHDVATLQEFNSYISNNLGSVSPGGFWLGDFASPPTVAWFAEASGFSNSIIVQNIIDNLLSNVSISTSFAAFDIPPEPIINDFGAILFAIYFSMIFCLYPAFYALYPTVERLRQARALQYSNGVRSTPMWLAYTMFDFLHVLAISIISTVLLSIGTKLWFHLPYIFLILMLYGISTTLLGYVISMFAKSQLAAWAFCVTGQIVMCLAYFGAYLGVRTGTGTADLRPTLDRVQYSIGLFSPIANLMRSLFVSLNQFSLLCGVETTPGSIALYGGPILYLILQCFALFAILLSWDSGKFVLTFRRNHVKQENVEDTATMTKEVSKELARANQASSGLRVMHLSKSFGRNHAVDDVTFGTEKSEIVTLLGPNGAGKSTVISLIRGDIKPSSSRSKILIDDVSISSYRAKARARLGVCPQFDATDLLTVHEHLKFYTRVRGVTDPTHNVEELIRACGLEPYRHQLASKLSGGTKRKLSLAIAMAGNPSVLLLDEPSSGLDAASKRSMWNTLSSISPGRSILLTTHSMEEADALADRAAIMSSRILALGTCDELRRRWGDLYHVHLVMRSAPYTSDNQMELLKQWVRTHLKGVKMDEKTYCGQLRFSVPARIGRNGIAGGTAVGDLFRLLESNKEALGIEYYSIGETTLDQVFVNVVREHGGQEEGSRDLGLRRRWWGWKKA